MTNIGHIVVCDESFNGPQGEIILKQPLSMIFPPVLPTNYTFVVSVGLINLKQKSKYKVSLKFISPSGKTISENNIEFEIDDAPDDPVVVTAGGFNMNFRNVLLEEEGDHTISVTLGQEEKTLPLPIIKRR